MKSTALGSAAASGSTKSKVNTWELKTARLHVEPSGRWIRHSEASHAAEEYRPNHSLGRSNNCMHILPVLGGIFCQPFGMVTHRRPRRALATGKERNHRTLDCLSSPKRYWNRVRPPDAKKVSTFMVAAAIADSSRMASPKIHRKWGHRFVKWNPPISRSRNPCSADACCAPEPWRASRRRSTPC